MLKVDAMGFLGRDAERRTTQNGKTVITLSVAVNNPYRQNAPTNWVKVELWGERWDKVQPILLKGREVWFSGVGEMESFTGNQGDKVTILKVSADHVRLTRRPKEEEQN